MSAIRGSASPPLQHTQPSSRSPSPQVPRVMARPMSWRRVLLLSMLLGCVSLILSLSFHQELEGHWEVYSGFRKTGAKLVNSGTLWALLAFHCGSRAPHARSGALAGMVSAECALATHYLLGVPTRVYDLTDLSANIHWFIAGVVLCCPLGGLGWLSARRGAVPLICRFTPVLCALSEPFITRRLHAQPLGTPWSERYSDLSSGLLLLIGGLLWGCCLIYEGVIGAGALSRRPPRASRRRRSPEER